MNEQKALVGAAQGSTGVPLCPPRSVVTSASQQVSGEAVPAPALPAKSRRHATQSGKNALPDILKFYNDPVHAVVVRALCALSEWKECEGFDYAYSETVADADITVGFPCGSESQKHWQLLKDNSPSNLGSPCLLKGHFTLWARYYDSVDSGQKPFIEMSASQFCADLGYKKHVNGGFRLEQKRRALAAMEALGAIELRAVKNFPKQGKKLRLRGNIWIRGIIGEQTLPGEVESGNGSGAQEWEPILFSFMPGSWFQDPEWKKRHQFLGKIGKGFTQLSNNTDEWAIYIASYLAVRMRSNGYRTTRCRIGTILQRAGLAQSSRASTKTSELREKLIVALDKLVNVGIIEAWNLEGARLHEIDMDDVEALTEYGKEDVFPPGDWRNHIISITPPFGEDAKRLQDAVVKSKRRRPKNRAKPVEE